METLERLRPLIREALHLEASACALERSTGLLGNLPEFDSVAVIGLLTAIEEHFGFALEDDDLGADVFESVGSLCDFIDRKLGVNPDAATANKQPGESGMV